MIHHLVFDGVADGALGIALELCAAGTRLVRAGLVKAREERLAQRVWSMDGLPVRSAAGRVVTVDGAFRSRKVQPRDVVVLPGMWAATQKEVVALLSSAAVVKGMKALRNAAKKGAIIGASCSSTFVLAEAGLLNEREATTTWWLSRVFARRFPNVRLRSEKMVVEAHGVWTAGAAFAHADLLLAMLSREVSPSLAELVARYLLLEERSTQARYMISEHLRSSDPSMQKLEVFVLEHLDQQLSLEELARVARTSVRTLARRMKQSLGTTPTRFVQRMRISKAVHLLETTNLAVEEIAEKVGYADPAAFRRNFRREMGESPRSCRSRKELKRPSSEAP